MTELLLIIISFAYTIYQTVLIINVYNILIANFEEVACTILPFNFIQFIRRKKNKMFY